MLYLVSFEVCENLVVLFGLLLFLEKSSVNLKLDVFVFVDFDGKEVEWNVKEVRILELFL